MKKYSAKCLAAPAPDNAALVSWCLILLVLVHTYLFLPSGGDRHLFLVTVTRTVLRLIQDVLLDVHSFIWGILASVTIFGPFLSFSVHAPQHPSR